MSRMGTAVLAFIGLTVIAFMLVGCDGFFVSENSVASIAVNPQNAVLSSSSGGTLQMSASTTLVNNSTGSCSSTSWTTSDTTGSILTIDPNSGLVTPVGAGQATVTVKCGGTNSSAIPIDVVASTFSSTLTVNLSTTTVNGTGGTMTATAVTSSGTTIPSGYLTWTPPSGCNITTGTNINSATITCLSATAGTTANVSVSGTTNGSEGLSGQSSSIIII